ncbi:MAG TPA: ribulokinase [Thermoleophilaceae bacterium]|nr:ribulokinase [Thermoleophilaceae bacterium]
MSYVVGVDFGTLSARAVVVDARDGAEVGSAVHDYRHGVMDRTLAATGAELPPQWALQDPDDYLEALAAAVPEAVRNAGVSAEEVVGIGTDFTASSPLPVLADGTPLCKVPGFEDRPHAYVKLWKHHAQHQADRVNAVAEQRGEPWLARYGGRISSEWEFAKALQVLEEDPEAYERMDRWLESADWIVWQLCGHETRSVCTAGYKAIHQDGAYPSVDYLRALDERFEDFVSAKLECPLSPLGARAGDLTAEAAGWTGLPEGIAVAVGNVDAHVTAPAARAIDHGQMLMIMGTSTCHVMNSEGLAEVPGMCGVVRDGIVPGLYGYEAGQTGVGDIFGWFVEQAVPPRYHEQARALGIDLHEHLSQLAAEQEVGAHGLVALDWNNGNRSVLVDHELSGLIVGLTLATRAEDVYRALVEATAFGTRVILDAFADAGLPVGELFAAGGLIKNPLVMQVYADVTRMPLHLIGSEQGPALGSAMHAAVAAGIHPDIRAAAAAMGKVSRDAYVPDAARADAYDALYEHYVRLHDHFGRGGDDVMHELRQARPRELARG